MSFLHRSAAYAPTWHDVLAERVARERRDEAIGQLEAAGGVFRTALSSVRILGRIRDEECRVSMGDFRERLEEMLADCEGEVKRLAKERLVVED